jgi:hypothetical protein
MTSTEPPPFVAGAAALVLARAILSALQAFRVLQDEEVESMLDLAADNAELAARASPDSATALQVARLLRRLHDEHEGDPM